MQSQASQAATTSSESSPAAPNVAPASPVDAATSHNQESAQDPDPDQDQYRDRDEDRSEAMEESGGGGVDRSSEVRRIPECEEDDDVIIPLPDDARRSNARDEMEMDTHASELQS